MGLRYLHAVTYRELTDAWQKLFSAAGTLLPVRTLQDLLLENAGVVAIGDFSGACVLATVRRLMTSPDPASATVPQSLHLTGRACSLRNRRAEWLHSIAISCWAETERMRAYGGVFSRDGTRLLQFNSYMALDGQLIRHTAFFSGHGKHRVAVHHGGTIEVVQLVHGNVHVGNWHSPRMVITESTLLCCILVNWSWLMQGHRQSVSLLRLPRVRLETCDLFKGDEYVVDGTRRVDIVLRTLAPAASPAPLPTGLPAVLTFDKQRKQLLAFRGLASYCGDSVIPVSMQLVEMAVSAQ